MVELLKTIPVFNFSGANREIFIYENIYSDYSENHLSISVFPDDYKYKIKHKSILATFDYKPMKIYKSYILKEYPEDFLLLNILKEPTYMTKRMREDKIRALLYFQVFFKRKSKINPFIPLFLIDKEGNILIEERLHNILLSPNFNLDTLRDFIKNLS